MVATEARDELAGNAIGLREVLFQSITHMAPGAAGLAFLPATMVALGVGEHLFNYVSDGPYCAVAPDTGPGSFTDHTGAVGVAR